MDTSGRRAAVAFFMGTDVRCEEAHIDSRAMSESRPERGGPVYTMGISIGSGAVFREADIDALSRAALARIGTDPEVSWTANIGTRTEVSGDGLDALQRLFAKIGEEVAELTLAIHKGSGAWQTGPFVRIHLWDQGGRVTFKNTDPEWMKRTADVFDDEVHKRFPRPVLKRWWMWLFRNLVTAALAGFIALVLSARLWGVGSDDVRFLLAVLVTIVPLSVVNTAIDYRFASGGFRIHAERRPPINWYDTRPIRTVTVLLAFAGGIWLAVQVASRLGWPR